MRKPSTNPTDQEERVLLREWAASLDIQVGETQVRALGHLRSFLMDWNSRMNLTAIRDPHAVLIKHFLDSLTVVPRVPQKARVLDVGSGAGFPGLVIRIVRPDVHLSMVEASARKVGFLEHARRSLGLDQCEILHRRLDGRDSELTGSFDAVVSRAVGSPVKLLPLSCSYLKAPGIVICMLGRSADSPASLKATGHAYGYELASLDTHELPEGAGVRHLAVFRLLPAGCST